MLSTLNNVHRVYFWNFSNTYVSNVSKTAQLRYLCSRIINLHFIVVNTTYHVLCFLLLLERERERYIATRSFGNPLAAACDVGMFRPACCLWEIELYAFFFSLRKRSFHCARKTSQVTTAVAPECAADDAGLCFALCRADPAVCADPTSTAAACVFLLVGQ